MEAAIVRVDPTLEREAETVLAGLGLSMTAAVNLFLRQTSRRRHPVPGR